MAAAEDDYSDIAACGWDDEDDDSLQRRFNMAADRLVKMAAALDQQTLLRLYGYYKQATEGPCGAPRPGGWFDARGKAKWDAWHSLGDLSPDEARRRYVQSMEAIEPGCASHEQRSKTAALSWVAVSTLAAREDEVAESEETIWDAARAGRTRRVATLLAADARDAERRDGDGMAAAHWAADRGHAAVLDTLIQHAGAGVVHQTDSCGQTPLHYAAACGHADVARVLLAAGATLAPDRNGDTPLDLADPTDQALRQLLRSAPDK